MRKTILVLLSLIVFTLVACEEKVEDTTAPVVTIVGEDTIYIEYLEPYGELSAICKDDIDESCEITIGGDIVNIGTSRTYVITYSAVDSSGNESEVISRTVIVEDSTSPVITLDGESSIEVEYNEFYVDLGATCTDNYNIVCTVIINIINVDTTVLGTYTVTYNSTDSEGNVAAEITRTVVVIDSTSPVITLIGESSIELEYNGLYEDLGATCIDEYDDVCEVVISNSLIDTSILGSNLITYNVTDSEGNVATEATRTVIVKDSTLPVITINDEEEIEIEYGTTYSDLGATCTDEYDDICTVVVDDTNVDTTVLGTYTVTYNSTDSEGNKAIEVIRTVIVKDSTLPVITINGYEEVEIEYGSTYSELGFTCIDNVDTPCEVVIGGDIIDTYTLGVYVITYNVTDSSGNIALEVTRSITVEDTTAPIIDASQLRSTVTLDGTFDFSLATCTDNRDTECVIEVVDVIDTSVLTTQFITINAVDAIGNESTVVLEIEVIEGLDTTIYIPEGYYDSITGLTGGALKDALNDIITNHSTYPYTSTNTDTWDMLREADEDPDNSDNVIMFYSGFSWPKECQDTLTANLPDYCFEGNDREADYTEWNREHIWSKSRGDFGTTQGAGTDAHHLVAAERTMNSIKNNRMFEDCHDGDDNNLVDRGFGNFTCNTWDFEPRDEVKGDVARMIFYMATRYESEDSLDLYLLDDADSDKSLKLAQYGDLDDLLRWHLEDPVDEWELERNQVIYTYQGNRNPFIDNPDLVEEIWGTPENVIEYDPTLD